MSFGKRSNTGSDRTREVVDFKAATSHSRTSSQSDVTGDNLTRVFGAAAALVIGFYCVYAAIVGSGLDTEVDDTELTKKHFAVLDMCTEDLDASPDMVELSQRHTVAMMGGNSKFKKPKMLNCMMTRSVRRFCVKQNRKEMVRELVAFFESAAAAERYINHVVKRSEISMMALNRARESMGGVSPINGAEVRLSKNNEVVTTMQDLIKKGYLLKSDFGWLFVSKAVKPHLESVTQEHDSCAERRT